MTPGQTGGVNYNEQDEQSHEEFEEQVEADQEEPDYIEMEPRPHTSRDRTPPPKVTRRLIKRFSVPANEGGVTLPFRPGTPQRSGAALGQAQAGTEEMPLGRFNQADIPPGLTGCPVGTTIIRGWKCVKYALEVYFDPDGHLQLCQLERGQDGIVRRICPLEATETTLRELVETGYETAGSGPNDQ